VLDGRRTRATIWVNGTLIGRWLSNDGNSSADENNDKGWLRHGFGVCGFLTR